jgi:NADH-quinone oxidoreductase subunit J
MDSIPFKDIFFYITAVVTVATAILTVTTKNVLHSAVALSGAFFGTAVLYFLLSAEFMAVAQVMVYIGGVVVFVVFAILLTSRLGEKALDTRLPRKIVAVFFSVTIAALAVALLKEAGTALQAETEHYATLSEIGKRLLSPSEDGFLLPFEAISLLLLISLIGAITIAHTSHEERHAEEK